MKKILFAFSTLMMMSCTSQKTEFSQEALSETLTATGGQEVAFADVIKRNQGKATLIEVWASWCGDCIKSMPMLKDTQQKHPDVNYVFISADKTPEAWKAGIEKHQLDGDHYLIGDGMKGRFGKAIDLDWIPRYIILDKTGKVVVYRAIEKDFDKINSTLASLK